MDFRALNREAIKAGNYTSKGQGDYRKQNVGKEEFRLKQGADTTKAHDALPSHDNGEYMYGKASRCARAPSRSGAAPSAHQAAWAHPSALAP